MKKEKRYMAKSKQKGKKGSLLSFIFIVLTFGGAGLISLFILSLVKPRWFPLFFRVVKFFVLLPFKNQKEIAIQNA